MDSSIILIQKTYIKDELGQRIPGEEKRCEILVRIDSVGRTEFYKAGQSGLNPEFVFVTARINYSGEQEVEYDGKRYAVYRTYSPPDSDDIELYVHKKVGVQ